ncbi:hypothetical protein M1M11_02565 [Pseudomonas azerbaijanoccidens]|uniref:hypothetical protein n=1 Tax=Pseudomonas azerbaijanoccidentalis TaxID=2842347 RepID=UPI00200A1112|nr:hypothetical protein [Pseudomonas azerbaijanoccidentalis]MCK8663761.1 hypothetical protein [Pseudomonas azerbaijanoccidentalis]
MVKLAHDIGVSDVTVTKAFRKAGIPLLSRGHWAKPEKQRPRKPKPPLGEGKVRFQVLDRTTLPTTAGTDPELRIVQRVVEVPHQPRGALLHDESSVEATVLLGEDDLPDTKLIETRFA